MAYERGEHGFEVLARLITSDGQTTWDFTLLFEDAFILLSPLALGLLFVSAALVYNSRGKLTRKTKLLDNNLGWIKIALYGLLLAFTVASSALLIHRGIQGQIQTSRLSYAAAGITILCALLVPFDNLIHHAFYLRPSSPSQLLLGYWILSDVATIRTRWLLGADNRTLAILDIVSVFLKLAIIIVEEWSKRGILLPALTEASPESLSGIFNRLFLAWMNPLMYHGLGGKLSLADLEPLEHNFSSEKLANRQLVQSNCNPDDESLLLALVREHWYLWIAPIPMRLAQAAFSFAQPFLLQRTIDWLYGLDGDNSTAIGYGLLGAYAVVYVGLALTTAFGQYQVVRLMTAIRGSLIIRIYRRSLESPLMQSHDLAPLTLMSTNIERIVLGMQYFHEAITSIPILGIALWLLEGQVGVGAVGPIAIVAVLAVVIGVCVPAIGKAQKLWLVAVQERIQLATQLLGGFQSAKMTGLMGHLAAQLQASRISELRISLAARRFQVMTNTLGLGAPELIPVLVLGVYAAVLKGKGETLTLYGAFSALSYIVLITFPMMVLLQTAPLLVIAFSSLKQIDQYLHGENSAPENDSSTLSIPSHDSEKRQELAPPITPSGVRHMFSLLDCTVGRDPTKDAILQDLNFKIAKSAFTYIIGPSSSGKTTLLEAILGELPLSGGSITRAIGKSDVAYAAQTPWIRNASVKSNIVQDSPMDEEWYFEVVRAVALERDLKEISRGPVGVGGTGLSGGQRQKVSLARALYSRRSVLIVDEPFTGIDGTSCEEITQRVFGPQGLLRRHGITLIVASHSAKFASSADHVVLLDASGRVAQQGSLAFLNLAGSNTDLITPDGRGLTRPMIDMNANPVAYAAETTHSPDRRCGEWNLYKYYFAQLGYKRLFPTALLVLCLVFCQLFPQWWVIWWTASENPNDRLGYWLSIYAILGVGACLTLFVACCFMLLGMVQAAGGGLHSILTRTIEKAPISLFSSMSPGLTVNRFSQDMSLVDMDLPIVFANTGIWFTLAVGQLVQVVIASKWLAIAIPFVLVTCAVIQQLYVKTSRQLRFLDIESKSPLYTHFIETLNGLPTIRAYGLQTALQEEMYEILDVSQKPFYLMFCAQRYLGLALNFTVATLAILVIGIAIAQQGHGVSTYYPVSLINVMTWGANLAKFIDSWCLFDVSLAAVERTKEFSEDTAKESTSVVDVDCEMPFDKGAIEIEDLSVGYTEGNPTVQGVRLSIKAGEKVAICGRSGSGKSTLCFALLRMLEATQGTIKIDNRPISRIPHDDLRNLIASIPQDPLILKGTLRYNLDPLKEKSDADLEEMVHKVGLAKDIEKDHQTLDSVLSADLLSFAEKQLICLARALLKQRKVLILDEATSSVDSSTDRQIQDIICKQLPGVTVVSVMHRLDQIRSYDRVLLMSDGKIAEDGSPEELLRKPGSRFLQLYTSWQHS